MPAGRVQDVLNCLHKGLGIRRPDLCESTAAAFATWQVSDDEPAVDLRSRLIWHINAALDGLGNQAMAKLGRFGYNLDRDPERSKLLFLDRLIAYGPGRKDRDFHSTVKRAVATGLNRPLPVPPDALAELAALEYAFSTNDQPEQHQSALYQAIRNLYVSPVDASIDAFLHAEVLTPRSASGLIVTDTARAGYWVCAFTTPTRLREHAKAAALPWTGGWLTLRGIELVRVVRQLPMPAGVLLDPPDSISGDLTGTLPLPAEMIATLAVDGE